MFRPLVRSYVARIGEDSFLPAVQYHRHLGDVGFIGGGTDYRVHQARGNIHPNARFHAKVPTIALLGLMHLRVTRLPLVLGRGRGGDDRAHGLRRGRLLRLNKPRSSSIADTSANIAWLNSCCSSQWRKFRIVVSSWTAATARSMPAKPREAWPSYSASSITAVGQPIPFLQEVDP
jgi:hypothetical protein